MLTAKAIYDAYIDRSWRALAERQQARGIEFVVGKRAGPYFWNLDGDRQVLDCGASGGVHSLGHRHPEIVDTMRQALDRGLDAGLWALPNAELLEFQDALAAAAPDPLICRSVVTATSTQSIDLAIMFSFRVTGRRRAVAYRYGYHGHGGFAAIVTGSDEEGVRDYYHLPTEYTGFFTRYGQIDDLEPLVNQECAAVILEAFNYETFQPAPSRFLSDLAELCRSRGVLLIIDETRTGLSRSGRFWMTQHYDARPDMLILGKGLGGGIYPVSAVLATREIYDFCMNGPKYGYMSSMGGNPLGTVVASKVIEVSQRDSLLKNVVRIEAQIRAGFKALVQRYPDVYESTAVLGAIATLGLKREADAPIVAGEMLKRGVYIHSVSLVEPLVVKFFPSLISTAEDIDKLLNALDDFASGAH